MATVDSVKQKVQRILTDELGKVEIDRDGDYVVHHESAVCFVHIYPMNDNADADIVIRTYCPMVVDVPLTADVFRWVAVEGQQFHFGNCYINPNEDGKTGWIYFKQTIIGNDLDPNELLGAVFRTVFTSNDLDDMLKSKFGGKLFKES